MTQATLRDLGTILHRPACWQARQFASSIATVSLVDTVYGPMALSGVNFRNSTIKGPTPFSAQSRGPINRACTRAHATNTTGNAPFSMPGYLRPLAGIVRPEFNQFKRFNLTQLVAG